ncbi:MAG: SDR family oxidoreductase [Cytophagaceae bacterium]
MYKRIFHKKNLSNYTFLITGGAGFIGSNLVEYLIKYDAGKVVVLDNLFSGSIKNIEKFLSLKNFQFIEGDIRSLEVCRSACKGIDYVFHQAALGSVPRSIEDPLTTNEVNVSGFLNVLHASKENNVKRFVYAASSSVYGDSIKLPKIEDEIGKPLSPYAVTKLVNELYADVFYKVYGLENIGLRYFNIFGPNQSPEGEYAAVIPQFINKVLNGQAPEINGDGSQSRDFTFVENAVQANIKAAFCDKQEAINNVFNIAVGEKTTLNQLAGSIAEIAGSSIKPVHRSPRMGDIPFSHADISKAEGLLDYKPEVRINEGLKHTVEWFRGN